MQWRRRYSRCGTMELHCPFNPFLQADNIIVKGTEAAIIESIERTYTAEEGDMLTVLGRFTTAYLARRIIWGQALYTNTREYVMKALVAAHDRGLGITPAALQGFPGMIDYQRSYGNILEEESEIAEDAKLGFYLSHPDLTFYVYAGLDRTAGQTINPQAVFDDGVDSVISSVYYLDTLEYSNVALVGGQGEGADRLFVTVGNAAGRARRELFVDARDIGPGTAENPVTTEQQLAALATRGAAKLSEAARSESLTHVINPYEPLVYRQDYNLGDVVTLISRRWGLTVDMRITEVNEIYEESGFRIEPTFGYERPVRRL